MHHISKQNNCKYITARLVPFRMKQASAAQLSTHTLHSAWMVLLIQTSSFHNSYKAAMVQFRVPNLSRQMRQTLAHQHMTNLKGIMSNLKGVVSTFKGTMSNVKGTMRKLKGVVSNLTGTVSKSKGTVCNLKGTASPRLAGTPVAKAKGKNLEVWVLVQQAFCITQGYHLKSTSTARLCATCSAVP